MTLSSALSDDDDVIVVVGGITVVEDSNAIMLLCDDLYLYDDVYGDLFNVVSDSVLDTIAITTSMMIP